MAAPWASPFAVAGTAGGSGSGGRRHADGAPGVEQQQQQQSTASSPRKAAGSPAWQQQAGVSTSLRSHVMQRCPLPGTVSRSALRCAGLPIDDASSLPQKEALHCSRFCQRAVALHVLGLCPHHAHTVDQLLPTADATAFSRATSAMSVGSITSAGGQQVERASANARDTMRRMWAIQVGPLDASPYPGLLLRRPAVLRTCLQVHLLHSPIFVCCLRAWVLTAACSVRRALTITMRYMRTNPFAWRAAKHFDGSMLWRGRQAALFTSGTIGLLIFPFITYVPSSGALGDMLPKVRQYYHVRNLTCFVTFCQVARL